MHLHILAGCRDLLRPSLLPSEQVGDLLGPRIRPATAFWLSSRCGRFYHDFLLDRSDDRRIEVFAHSLRDNFGTRFEPLIVLPELFASTSGRPISQESQHPPLDMLRKLWHHHPAETICLHALVLPQGIDADDSWAAHSELLAPWALSRLDGLRVALATDGRDPISVEIRVTEIRRDMAEFDTLLRNAIACQIARRATSRLSAEGLQMILPELCATAFQILTGWHKAGLRLAPALGSDELERLTDRIIKCLMEDVSADA